jgi:hypothetical protein
LPVIQLYDRQNVKLNAETPPTGSATGTDTWVAARLFSQVARPGSPTERTSQVAAVPESIMSNTEQNKSKETGKHELSEDTDRPAGTVDEDANPPLTDETKTDVDRNPETVPPQDTGSAVPPYEGRT